MSAQTAQARLLDRLRSAVGAAHMLTDRELTASYETDWTGVFHGEAGAVVRPHDTAEVVAVLRACGAVGVPVVVQGGNTGMVGGGVPAGGEVLLSTRRLDGVGAVERIAGAASVVVGAGATLAAVQAAVRPAGLDVAVDLGGARGSATIGGMVATNAGGERVVRHGPMRAQVAGLEAVLASGAVVGRLSRPPKDNTGYDLEQLLVGSEGTLAVVTRVRLRLVPLARRRAVALVAVDGTAAAVEVLAAARRRLVGRLASVELLLAPALELALASSALPAPFAVSHHAYVLLEVDDGAGAAGDGPGADPGDLLAALLADLPDVRDAALAVDASGVADLWRYREGMSEALAAAGRPVKLDVAVPLAALAAFVDELPALVAAAAAGAGCAQTRTVVFGHFAEGNLHVNVLGPDAADDTARGAVTDAVLRRVAALGGSVSAEHGVGRAKTAWLALSRSPAEIAAMAAVKRALDPSGLLGPGVLLPAADHRDDDPASGATDLHVRHAEPSDHARVLAVVDEWWGGRAMAAMLPRLFFVHFRPTSFVLEQDGRLAGFLCGFVSQTDPGQAYVHFVGVDPGLRGRGAGRLLYERFFAAVRERGCTEVHAVTSPVNTGSVAFHTALGFVAERGGGEGYDGPGEDRVRFTLNLLDGPAAG